MIPTPRHALRGLVAAFLLGLLAGPAYAGDISGRVVDNNTGRYLPGATVTLTNTGQVQVTDGEGRFRFANVAAGNVTLQAEYLGYANVAESVEVPATGSVPVSLALRESVLKLEQFVVEGYREGRSRALQQKRSQPNITDIISADAIGNLPDRNVAEAVARLPGVNVTGMDQGEGVYVSIRGIEPNLNQVLMDGAVMAAPGGTRLGRAVPLDALASSQVAQIEVIKSTTPDMDANALGGTINIKTATAFDRQGRYFAGSALGNYNENSEKTDVQFKVSASDLLGANKAWGFAATLNYDKRSYSNHWLQTGWNLRSIAGANVYLPNGLEIKPEEGTNTRKGGNLSIDFRPDADTQFYLRPSFSTQRKQEHTVEILHSVDNAPNRVTLLSPTSALFDGTRTRTERRDFDSLRDQEVLNVVGGFKKVFGSFTLEPMASWSHAKEDRIRDNILAFRNSTGGTGPITLDWGQFDFVSLSVDPAVDIPSKYPLRRTREDFGVVEEDTYTAKVDLRWDSDNLLGHRGYLKGGFKYLQRNRVVDLESRRLVPVGSWSLTNVGSTLPSVPVYDGRFQSGFRLDPTATWNFIRGNPTLVTVSAQEQAANSTEDDYSTDEFIYALYGMGSVTINKLTLLGGVRWEKTDATLRAVEARTFAGSFVGYFPNSGYTDFSEICPNLQAIYRFANNLVMRAAVTKTIGRPAYEDTRPFANLQFQPLASPLNPAFPFTGSVNVGNPDLDPYSSLNYDLSLEWYPQRTGGILSVALFRKEIDNPIFNYTQTEQNFVYNGQGFESISFTSTQNAQQGRINGVELNLYQPLKFLPHPFDGLGLDANVTFISSSVVVPARPTEDLPFFRQPSKIRNVTLFYEKARFSGRVAYSYSDESMETLGSNILNDRVRVPRDQIDVLFRYRLTSNFSINASVRNLTREKEQRSTGVPQLMQYSRLLGRDYKVGIDFNF